MRPSLITLLLLVAFMLPVSMGCGGAQEESSSYDTVVEEAIPLSEEELEALEVSAPSEADDVPITEENYEDMLGQMEEEIGSEF